MIVIKATTKKKKVLSQTATAIQTIYDHCSEKKKATSSASLAAIDKKKEGGAIEVMNAAESMSSCCCPGWCSPIRQQQSSKCPVGREVCFDF